MRGPSMLGVRRRTSMRLRPFADEWDTKTSLHRVIRWRLVHIQLAEEEGFEPS